MADTNNLTPDLRTYLNDITVKYEDNSPPQTANPLIKTEEVYCKEEHIERPQDNQPKTLVWNLMQFQLGFSPYGLPLTSLLHNNIQVKRLSDPPLGILLKKPKTIIFVEVKQEDEGPASKATSADNTSETGALSSNSKKIKKENSKDSPSEEKNVKTKAPRKKKVFWTQEEDARALELLTELGPKWTKIGRMIGDRSGKQVRDRYLQNLKPNINFEKWTKEEDALIVELYNKFGSKWLQIAEHLPNRTDNQVKNRFHGKLLHQMPQLDQDVIEPIVKSETDVKVEHSS